jgi:hypothetical protein
MGSSWDRICVGFLLSAGQRGWKAYDDNGRPIGLFDSEELAARAVYEQAEAAPGLTEGG